MIRAAAAQRKGIEDALREWTFRPHAIAEQSKSRPGWRWGEIVAG